MASDNEASCVSDPNFAVICSFLEKFGSACGIQSPDFLELQEMLENTQEVSPELIDLHIKLLRKARRSVSGDRWERALIKLCHSYCSQDAWELERFGYKKARLSSKLQILKKLLEMQFDANPKFKAEINRLTAAELRTEPIGRDRYGHAYWYQLDEHCQVRVYREDLDEETWILVAKDREGLMRLISQLSSNDPNIGDLVLNEDSNSLSIEKPITDTGQTSSATSNCEVDESSAGNEIDESSAGNEIDESSAGNEVDESSVGNEVDESSTEIEASKGNVTDVAEQKLTNEEKPVSIADEGPVVAKNELSNNEMKVALDMARKTEIFSEVKEENVNQDMKDENSSEVMGIDLSMSQQSSSIISSNKSVDLSNKRKKSINELAVNLRIKTHEQLCKPAIQEQEIDLSMKKNKIDMLQPISCLSVPPYEPSFMETALRIPLEYHDSDEELEDEEDELYESDEIELPSHIKRPRFDRPTLLGNARKQPDSELDDEYGDEIEEEVMYVRGEGSGRDCNNENTLRAPPPFNNSSSSSTDVEVSEAIEESVMFVYGEGSGYECDAGNNGTDEETSQDNKTEDCKSSSAGTSDVPVSEDNCDNVNKTDAECSSSKSEADTVSVSNKSSVNPEESCTVMLEGDQIIDCLKTDVHSVDSAIKSDNNSDNTNIQEVKSNLADRNMCEDSVSRQNDEQTVKLPKVGKIIVDVKSLAKPKDMNYTSPMKKSRWDVGKPCIDMVNESTASSSVEPTNILDHKEGNVNILEVSASTNCSINDKLVGDISKEEIVNATDAANTPEKPQEEINCLPKGKVQEMVSKWEHAFDENKSNMKKSLITNIEDLVHDSDKSVQLKNTQPTVASQKFFFGPGCFLFNSLISKSPEKKNIENTSTCTTSEDIKHECDVNENKNEETCSVNVNSDDTLKLKADSTNINVDQHVNANQSVDSSSSTFSNDTKTSISDTIQNTPVLSQTETIPNKEDENCTIIISSRKENVTQNIIDTEPCLELKSTLTESSVDSGSTSITCLDIDEIKHVPEPSTISSSCEVDGDTSQTCIENSTKNILNTKDISQVSIKEIRTEDDVKSDEVITSVTTETATESETSKSDNKEIKIPLESLVLTESENTDDVIAESTSVQDTNKDNVKSNEVNSAASNDFNTNDDISDSVECTSSIVKEDNETQVAEESDIVQSKTENIQVNVGNNSSEKTAHTENQIVSETDKIFTGNVQEKKSEETDNRTDEMVVDHKEQTVTETVHALTENVQLVISEEKESYMEETDEKQSSLLDTESEQSNKSDEINSAGEITDSEKRIVLDVSNIAQTTNESGSCSVTAASVNENSDTSQDSTENKHLSECEIENTCTEMDVDIHTVSDISDDTSSLQVEISSLDKDQGSSNESMDVTNSSLQEDDNELQNSTENSETSIVSSDNTQLQIFGANKINFVKEIMDNNEKSLIEISQSHADVNKRCEKEDSDIEEEHTDITQELTKVDQSSSPGLVVESCSVKTDINIEAVKTIPNASELSSSTQESMNNNQSDTSHATLVLMEDSIESDKQDVVSSLEQENNDNTIATEEINSDNTCSVQEDIETERKTILNTAQSSTAVLHENVPFETSNYNEKEHLPVLQGTKEPSCNIKSLSIEEKEIISNVVDTSVGTSKSETCTQNISEESNDPNVELPNIGVKNDQSPAETTEQTVTERTENVSASINANDKLTDTVFKKVNDENIQTPEFVETATDLSILKADTLKSTEEVKISTSNVVCFSKDIKTTLQRSTEVPLSDNIQICKNPINSKLHNTHLHEEHLGAEVDLRTNSNKGNEIEKESNALENIVNLEIKKNKEFLVCNTDINAEHMQIETGKRKEFDNIAQRLENFNENYSLKNENTVAVTGEMCKVSNVNTTLQLDNNLKLDAIKTSSDETNVLKQQTDHIETETTECSDTSKELITETSRNIDVRKDPLEICKDKEIPDIDFDESENEEFSSDEDRFESCIMDPNDDGEMDGESDEELNLEEKISLPKVNEQCEETAGHDEKNLKCDTVIEHTKVSELTVDQKKIIIPEENISKEDLKTVLDTQQISLEKNICKLEDVSTENKSSIEKVHMVNLKTDSDKPTTIDDNGKPTLMCVDITKLQDTSDIIKPVNKSVTELKIQSDILSPRSVESVGVDNEESSDIVDVPETDPLACTEEDIEKTEQVSPPAPSTTGLSLATFKLDGTETDNSLIPEPIARALRNRKISMEAAAAKETRKRVRPSVEEEEEAETNNSMDSKRRRMRGKRPVDVNLRRSVESKHADISSSDEDPLEKSAAVEDDDDSPTLETVQKNTTPRRGTGKARRGKRGRGRGSFANRTASSTPAQDSDLQSETPQTENTSTTSPVTKTPTSGRKKRRMLGLDIDPNILVEQNKQAEDSETTGRGTVVRQSRRIAQLKIKEEAERRKIEELTLTEIKEGYKKKKSKRDDDKDYKEDKKKRKQKQATDDDDEEESEDEVVEISGKKSRKKKRKHQDPRKLFNSTNPWQSSSGSSTSNDEEEDEEVEEEPSDEEAVLKSDHEFSPESDLESNAEVQPLRRARTVKKESDTEEPTDEHACQKCGKADHPEWILLCDKCDCGWHCSCLRPALLVIPEGDWFCPPCQHITLVEALKVQLLEYDKKVSRRDMEVRRQERLAYVGISLNNVLPAKEQDGNRNAEQNEQDEGTEEEESSNSESSSGSSSGDESEPIYQLRERRQAHSYRFNDYDELINSAIQDEIEAVKGAGNQGRGKDIATIVNAEKEEEAKSQALLEQKQQVEQQVQAPVLEPCPPVVPVYTEKQISEHDEASDKDSEEELRVVPKMAGRKKHRKLNSLDISSEDDPDDDEDFKGTSEEEEEDLEDLGTEDSDDYEVGHRGKRRSGPIRRSTRARTTRYDREFINDDSDDEEPRRKKTRSIWDESESEESDTSWGKRKKSKKQRQSTSPRVIKKSRKKKKRQEDSDPDVKSRAKPKKPKIKFGGLDDSDDDDEMLTRRTRGKKINYIDALGSDSEEDKSAVKRLDSEEEYVANEEDEEDQEDVADAIGGKESDSDSALERPPPPIVPKKLLNFKPARGGRGRGKGGIARTQKPAMTPMPASLSVPPGADEDDDDSPSVDIPVIAANPDDLNEEEVGTMMMENEEYAKKQLELMAIQLAKEKKKKEREAKQRAQSETTIEAPPVAEPKKRGRKKKVVVDSVLPIPQGQDQPPNRMNPSLTMSPPFVGQNQMQHPKTLLPSMNQGISPLLMQAPSPSKLDGIPPIEISSTVPTVVSELTPSPPKRRGRGKGKKTLAAEAAAAAGAPLPLTPTSTSTGSIVPPSASPVTTTTAAPRSEGVAAPVITAMSSTNEPPTNLSTIDANIHGGKLGIASPPLPFSQSQPAPSVITRMLQSQPVSSQQQPTFTTVASSMNQKYFGGGMCDQPPPRGQFSAIGGGRGRVPSPYRQSPPAGMNLYPGMRPVAPNSPHRLRSPGPPPPGMQQMFHSTHHPLDPSPSGGGPINIAAVNRDRNSPPTSKDQGPTPPPQYIRGPMGPGQRFTPADASPGPSLPPPPVRHHMSFTQQQQQPSPTRPPHAAGNFSPYHPPPPPNYHYGAYPPAPALAAAADDALPPTDYHQPSPYTEPHYSTGEPTMVHSSDGSNSKPFDEEGSGEFGGLVSYFSSQREDDLDT